MLFPGKVRLGGPCVHVGVVVGEGASVYMWEWWWGRRLVCTCGSGGRGGGSVYMSGGGGGG